MYRGRDVEPSSCSSFPKSLSLSRGEDFGTQSCLYFEGPWRVHCLLDVLLQHFRQPKALLPRLLASRRFPNATMKTAEVVKVSKGNEGNEMELQGCFFPQELRRFLEFLRVPL